MKWINFFIAVCLVACNILLVYKVQELKNREIVGNVIKVEDKYYSVYGLEGAGFVQGEYEVYYPVFMSEETYSLLADKERVKIAEYYEALILLNTIRHQIRTIANPDNYLVDAIDDAIDALEGDDNDKDKREDIGA